MERPWRPRVDAQATARQRTTLEDDVSIEMKRTMLFLGRIFFCFEMGT
jgi:hypothetical protein